MAKRHSAFQHIPYPNETLSPDIEVRQLANLHARLDDCAASYLKALGRLDRRAAAELTDTVHGIRSLTRPGYSPLNMYLLQWLRFANLLTYATDASLASEH
ncbi:hypothetical protein [Streptomyces griseorubiginosus]|uniref:hypothetical protein n=1 Tax=Streptomyces griseorubiginosus TaxID=67304 RepID=UPI0015E83178|nr:hypothetical protein [Streptomyces griseorubiginosus]